MEKRSPHCPLTVVKSLIDEGKVRPTATATRTASDIGLDVAAMIAIVRALTPAEFYKSMTTHADHTVWQDVYHPSIAGCKIYLKLTVIDLVLIVSFKEL
jgi:motility quorum-sensing regulator/GCU-specific mRNA interferase toxin